MSRTQAYRGEGLPGDPAYVAFFGGFWLFAGLMMHLVGLTKDDTALGSSAHDVGTFFLVGGVLMLSYAYVDQHLESEEQHAQVAHA